LEVQHHQLFLNNDSQMYSESAVNGKLKFMLIDKNYISKFQLLAQEAIIKSQTLVIQLLSKFWL
jgi:hypothetical protein